MAECGRWCPYQWTHSAVASTGGVDVLPDEQLGCRKVLGAYGPIVVDKRRAATGAVVDLRHAEGDVLALF